MKKKGKWTYCFFYIDINMFVREGVKVLKSFRPMKKLIDKEFLEMFDMKRLKINE
jgi:hypothetical protein